MLTLLEVLDVLGGEGDADAVHPRLLLAEALALDVSRHTSLGVVRKKIDWPDEEQKVKTSAVTCTSAREKQVGKQRAVGRETWLRSCL